MTQIFTLCPCLLTMCLAFDRVFKVNGELTTWPADTEAAVGQTIRLNCSTSDPFVIHWEHVPYGAEQKEYVYFGGEMIEPYDQRFKVVLGQETGRYDLVIESVQMEDAGMYRCSDREGLGKNAEAELIVLRKPPNCTCEKCTVHVGVSSCYVSKDAKPTIHCEVSYSGNIAPRISCSSEMNRNSIEEENESVITAKYNLQQEEDKSELGSGNLCYTMLSNISSNDFWIKRTTENYKIEQPSLENCELTTDRDCEYKWIRVERNNETMSATRLYFIEEPGIYRCEADCSLLGLPCKVQPVEVVFEPKEEGYSKMLSVAISVSIATIIAVIAVIVIIVVLKMRAKSKDQRKQEGTLLRPLE